MADDADRLVARAIESVLEQVPGTVETSIPEGAAAKLQPWAETAAPLGRNKRPLEDLLRELAQRVGAAPEARVSLPTARHPGIAFFDRFGRGGRTEPLAGGEPAPEGGGKRRRRRRGGAGRQGAAPEPVATPAQRPGGDRAPGRRRRRGRGGAAAAQPGAGHAAAPAAGGEGGAQQRSPGSGGGRRRRGRRGRGGGGGGAGPGGAGAGPPAGA